jgi:hypothetical protein
MNLMPDLIANLLSTTPAAKQFIADGVTFNVSFFDIKGETISKMRVDQAKLNNMLAKSADKIASIKGENDLSHVTPQVKQMLTMLNSNLPFEDPSTGIKVLNVSVPNENELTYTVEVPLDLVPMIKGEEARELLRSEILNSANFKTVLSGMVELGLTDVRYKYTDPSGEMINEFTLTKDDLL